MAVAEGVL